jgi:hypothetical protein
MNIALVTRKALIATVFVPMIAMTAVSVEPVAGLSGAEAQQAGRGGNNGGGNNGGGSRGGGDHGEKPFLLMQSGNCAQVGATHFVPCPPRVEVTEAQDCSCEVKYRMVGGQRVAVKDCYFEVNNEVRYCRSDAIKLR